MTPAAGEVTVGKSLHLRVSMVDSQGRSVANPPTDFTSSDSVLATVGNQDGPHLLVSLPGQQQVQSRSRKKSRHLMARCSRSRRA